MKTKLLCGAGLVAAAISLRLFASGNANEEFVAHEWGTFTSVQGADGIQIEWNPIIKTDLPEFVYTRDNRQNGFPKGHQTLDVFNKGAMPSFVRMETPVIYFYSDQARTADVRVQFPQGRITEWYPQATRFGPYLTTNKAEAKEANRSFIEWTGVKILPRATKEISADQLIRDKVEKSENHYYAARETDANFLRVAAPYARSGVEYERDLFYRGVGFLKGPLTLTLQANEDDLLLSTKTETVTDLFVLSIRNGMARYQFIDRVTPKDGHAVKLEAKPFAPLSDVRQNVMREMEAALARQGLYAKEAKAMVNTWKDQWFAEEGTRVLYLLSPAWTDSTLPLEISPRPSNVVRVMVGRAELITPSMERELSKQVTLYHQGDDDVKQQAVSEVRQLGLGRFLDPAARKMLGKTPPKEFSNAAWELVHEASKTVVGKAADVVEKQPAPSAPKKTATLSGANALEHATF
ncbi:MAG TPA: hypothetical protein VK846_05665 [Candidatus Limnocylindria bacterium]|nr:hypothetical protein [Candidatus Limnocylindria bacterium]